MKTFKIPVTWQLYGVMKIEANTLEEAKNLALEDFPLTEGNYIDASIELEEEEIINEMNL